jgi:hypothetical protein
MRPTLIKVLICNTEATLKPPYTLDKMKQNDNLGRF